MNMNARMSLGVKDYFFVLKTPCAKDAKKCCHVSLSFRLSGQFLSAAINDRIEDTVDYEALCNNIVKDSEHLNCENIDQFQKRFLYAASQFSPIISWAYFLMTLTCHASFTCEASFAIRPTLQSDHE